MIGFAVVLGSPIASTVWGQESAVGEVMAEVLDVFDEPDDKAFSTSRLQRGQTVTLLGPAQDGWQAIAPPPASFCWVDQDAIQELGGGLAEVVVDRAVVRPGRGGALMPGPARSILRRGERARLTSRTPLRLPQREGVRVWKAIEPPGGDVRYVRAEAIRAPAGYAAKQARTNLEARVPRVSFRSSIGADSNSNADSSVGGDAGLKAAVVNANAKSGAATSKAAAPVYPDVPLRDLDAMLKSIVDQPIESWRFEEIQARYAQKLEKAASPAEASAIRRQLDWIDRRARLAQDFRRIQTALRETRSHDQELERSRDVELNPRDRREPSRSSFLAVGVLNPSNKQYEGAKVYALYEDTRVSAYIQVPPGLRPDALVGKRVGVEGTARYSDALKAKILVADDLIVLD